jgi:hypothetical protein
LIHDTLASVDDTLLKNTYTRAGYSTAKNVSTTVSNAAVTYTEPLQVRLAPLIEKADGLANKAVDVVEAKYPYPFKATPEEVTSYVRERGETATTFVRERSEPAVNFVKERTEPAVIFVKERTEPAVAFVKERSETATTYVRERSEPAVTFVKEKTEPTLTYVKERTEPAVNLVRERSATAGTFLRERGETATTYMRERGETASVYVRERSETASNYMRERKNSVVSAANETLEKRVKEPVLVVATGIDKRFSPVVDYFEGAVSRFGRDANAEAGPSKLPETKPETKYQYQRAIALSKTFGDRMYLYSSDQIKQLQSQSVLLQRATETAHKISELGSSSFATAKGKAHDLSGNMLQELQRLQASTSTLQKSIAESPRAAQLREQLAGLSASYPELTASIQRLTDVIKRTDLSIQERGKLVASEVSERVGPVLEKVRKSVSPVLEKVGIHTGPKSDTPAPTSDKKDDKVFDAEEEDDDEEEDSDDSGSEESSEEEED